MPQAVDGARSLKSWDESRKHQAVGPGFFQRWLEVRFGKSDGQAAAPNRMFGRQAMKLLRGR